MITLKTLAQATAQEVFDQVATHLLKQGKKSEVRNDYDDKMVCVYRSPDGLKCAAGCLIGDDEYSPNMEGALWKDLIVAPEHRELIASLQRVHDKFAPDDWGIQLCRVAALYGLNSAAVDVALNRAQ